MALNKNAADIKINIGKIFFQGKTKATILIKSEITDIFTAVSASQFKGVRGVNKILTIPCKINKIPLTINFSNSPFLVL